MVLRPFAIPKSSTWLLPLRLLLLLSAAAVAAALELGKNSSSSSLSTYDTELFFDCLLGRDADLEPPIGPLPALPLSPKLFYHAMCNKIRPPQTTSTLTTWRHRRTCILHLLPLLRTMCSFNNPAFSKHYHRTDNSKAGEEEASESSSCSPPANLLRITAAADDESVPDTIRVTGNAPPSDDMASWLPW